jgi:hypothetical protein
MTLLSYRRHRFPPEIIQHAIWLYLRFTLSYRDVEESTTEWHGRGSPSLRSPLGDRYRAAAHPHQTPLAVAGG